MYHPQARHANQDPNNSQADPSGLDRAMRTMYVTPPQQGIIGAQQQFLPQQMQYVAVDGSQQQYYVPGPQYQQQVVGAAANGQPVYYRVNGNQTYPEQYLYTPTAVNPNESSNRMTYAQHAASQVPIVM